MLSLSVDYYSLLLKENSIVYCKYTNWKEDIRPGFIFSKKSVIYSQKMNDSAKSYKIMRHGLWIFESKWNSKYSNFPYELTLRKIILRRNYGILEKEGH